MYQHLFYLFLRITKIYFFGIYYFIQCSSLSITNMLDCDDNTTFVSLLDEVYKKLYRSPSWQRQFHLWSIIKFLVLSRLILWKIDLATFCFKVLIMCVISFFSASTHHWFDKQRFNHSYLSFWIMYWYLPTETKNLVRNRLNTDFRVNKNLADLYFLTS